MLLGIIFFRYNILKDILTRYNKSISDINYYYSYENEDYTNSVWRKGDLILQESYLKSDNSKVITWRDRTTNEGYKLFEKSKDNIRILEKEFDYPAMVTFVVEEKITGTEYLQEFIINEKGQVLYENLKIIKGKKSSY